MYHLFAGQAYYPQSGLGDYVGSFDSDDDAIDAGKEKCKSNPDRPWCAADWWVVITERDGVLVEVACGYGKN